MANPHPHKLPPGKGRPKGSKNKFTTLKQAFLNVYQDLGGEEFLKEVAASRQGKRDFFNAMVKMLPTKEEHSGIVEQRVRFIFGSKK